jgi:hypothetical protein
MDVNNNLMVLLNLNNSVDDRLNDNHHNVMLVLVLYLNQQNVKEHHVHLRKKNVQNNIDKTTTTIRSFSMRQKRDNIDIYEPNFLLEIFVLTIVSALEVDDDEGKNSLDKSRLTILSGSNCLNCGV